MADTLYAAQTPASSDTDDNVSRQLGLRYEAQVTGQVTGGRYWVPSAGLPPTALWQLWEVTGATSGTLLAEVDLTELPTPTSGTWMEVPLDIPVAQAASTEYIVCSYTSGGSFVFTFPSGVLPLTSTPDGHAIADAAVFRNGSSAATYPLATGGDSGTDDGLFFADVDFDLGSTDLTAADATHAHSADSPALTQQHELAAADAAHGHTAEQPALTQVHVLAVDSAVHGHTADSAALTQLHVIAPADAGHGHAADEVTVTVGTLLLPDSALHSHTAGEPDLEEVPAPLPAPEPATWGRVLTRQDLAAAAVLERQRSRLVCPNDGTSLHTGPGGELYCPFDGYRPDRG